MPVFNKPDLATLALVRSYKQQQNLSAQAGSLLVYYLTDDNSAHQLAVRCHWSVPAKELDQAFNDNQNKVRSRIVLSKNDEKPGWLFSIEIIDDTRTSEQAHLKVQITPNPQPITLASWNSSNDGQSRHNVVVVEYPN